MIEELVLHVGDCKTGTTSVQLTLAEAGWAAEGRSIEYPTRVNHIPLAKSMHMETEKRFLKPRITRVRSAFQSSEAEIGVISAEDFEFTDPQVLADALQQYMPAISKNMRLIAYVRPHAERLVSGFSERAKKGNFFGSLDGMHKRMEAQGLLYYAPRFEKWRAVFGDRFTLRPMIRAELHKNDVVEDFLRFVFRSDDFEITRTDSSNTSLSLEDLAMMRVIQKRIRKKTGLGKKDIVLAQQALGWNIAPMLAATPAGASTKIQLHRSLAEDVAKTYAEDAARLDEAFFEGTPMTDALAKAVDRALDEPQLVRPDQHLSPEEIRRLRVLGDFLTRIMEADPRYFARAARPPEHRNMPIIPISDQEADEDTGDTGEDADSAAGKTPAARMS